MSASVLFRLSGLAALVSGVLLALEGALLLVAGRDFPGPGFVAAHILLVFVLMCIYLLGYQKTGNIGLLGFLAASVGNLFFTARPFVSNVVRPRIVEVLIMERHVEALDAMDAELTIDFPQTPSLFALPTLAVGLLLLAVAHLRAPSRAHWALWLMLLGPAVALSTEPVGLPVFIADRIAPTFLGTGSVWPGYVLWSHRDWAMSPAQVEQQC